MPDDLTNSMQLYAKQNFRSSFKLIPFGLKFIFYLIIVASVIFITLCYNIKYRTSVIASGTIQYDGGYTKINSPKTGIISEVYVKEGEPINKGQPLFSVTQNYGQQRVQDTLRESINLISEQIIEIKNEISRLEEQITREKEYLENKRLAILAIRKEVLKRTELHKIQIKYLENELNIQQLNLKEGVVTRRVKDDISRELLHQRVSASDLKVQAENHDLRVIELSYEIDTLNNKYSSRSRVLKQEEDELTQRRLKLLEQQETTVFSGVNGYVSFVKLEKGNSISPGETETIEIISKFDASIIGVLHVESDDIFAVSIGDPVKLDLDSVDIVQAGSISATVLSVSTTPMNEKEMRQHGLDRGIYYKVTVKPNPTDLVARIDIDQFISGIGVEAYIQNDEKSLLSIFVDPILKAKETVLSSS